MIEQILNAGRGQEDAKRRRPNEIQANTWDRLTQLLNDPVAAKAMGDKGMAWVNREWHWDVIARRFAEILAGQTEPAAGGQA